MASTCRPSVNARLTFVYVQPVISQISAYEWPSALSSSARISWGRGGPRRRTHLHRKEVNERVVRAIGANVQVASGLFVPIAHDGRGTAAVVELPGGKRKLTLTDFETDSGPDLRVYVSTGDPASGGLGDFEDLGGLKGNIGTSSTTCRADSTWSAI